MTTATVTGADLKSNWKEQIRKKEKSLAHHFIEINIMMLSYTTKLKSLSSTRLKEPLHLYDTQKNEAMNNSIAKYAPKIKHMA